MSNSNSRGWIVTLCGAGLNLTLGCIYAWSVFSRQLGMPIEDGGFGWSTAIATLPYTIAIAVWALMMFPAGLIQDRYGPRIATTLSAICMGIGFVITSFASPENHMAAMIGFGVFMGAAIGFGYGAATPAAIKWFPLNKKGLITGLVVGGLGMASVYVAPTAKLLIANFGISKAFLYLGIGFALVAIVLAQFIRNPPAGYVPPTAPAKGAAESKPAPKVYDATPGIMLKEPVFYLLYIQFICATMAGLMIISQMAKIVQLQFDIGAGITPETVATTAVLSVSVLAIFNATGRVVCGVLSDLIGRSYTLLLVSALQCAVMLSFSNLSGMTGFYIGAALVGFNYGACMPVFAATAGDLWGMKNFGKNYAFLYTAWGISGVLGPMIGAFIVDSTGSYSTSYTVAAVLCVISVVLSLIIAKIVKERHAKMAAAA
jgi:MFS family permease